MPAIGRRLAILALALVAAGPSVTRADAAPAPRSYVVVLDGAIRDVTGAVTRRERSRGFEAQATFRHALNGFAAPLTDAQVRSLREDPNVVAVRPQRTVRAAGIVPLAPGDQAPTGARRIEAATTTTTRQAADTRIGVIDTGVDLDHPDLNVTAGPNCVAPGLPPDDDDGHGTHVAGIIGALNNGSGVVGVAPGTPLVSIKALNGAGTGTDAQVICGIDWAVATRQDADPTNNIGIINLSLAFPITEPVTNCPTTHEPLTLAICRATDAGILFVVAAGNDHRAFDTPPGGFGSPGPELPAALDNVLTAEAMTDSDGAPGGHGPSCQGDPDDTLASYSNYAALPTSRRHVLAAPGTCILSTARGGGVVQMKGTSMATPHVAAVAALCLGEAGVPGQCAGMTPGQMIDKLVDDAGRHATSTTYAFAGDPTRPAAFGAPLTSALIFDTQAPVLNLDQPAAGAFLTARQAVFSGTAGALAGDSGTVHLEVRSGEAADGPLALAMTAERSGTAWSLTTPAPGLPDGTYTARAIQDDDAGNAGQSVPVTFVVRVAGGPGAGPGGSAATGPRDPAKLAVSRARVVKARRTLEVLATISRRATGSVRVSYQSAGATTTFFQRIDTSTGVVRVSRGLGAKQVAAGTGIVTLRYGGNARTRPQEVRLRAASTTPGLVLIGRPELDGRTLAAEGTISVRATGVVRVVLDWQTAGVARSLELTAPIANGRFRLRRTLPAAAAEAIAAREGTLQSYVIYTGSAAPRLAGAMRSAQVLGPAG